MTQLTAGEYISLSPQDRAFYHEHKDDMEMCAVNGKLCMKISNDKLYVTWARFQEALKLPSNLTCKDDFLHIFTNFNDWNPYGRPYVEAGFYYRLDIDVSEYSLKQKGIETPAKYWLMEWLMAHDFTPDEAATVRYSGGISGYTKEEGYYKYKDYGFEVRCRFSDIPHHYLPTKVLKWLKRNPEWKDVVLKPETTEA